MKDFVKVSKLLHEAGVYSPVLDTHKGVCLLLVISLSLCVSVVYQLSPKQTKFILCTDHITEC